MSENRMKICRICCSNNKDDHITDSSGHIKIFIQMLSLKDFKENLYLCMWCKAVLLRTVTMLTLAVESERMWRTQLTKDKYHQPKSLYKLECIHNCHIDIPPLQIQDIDCKEIKKDVEEICFPLPEIPDKDEVILKTELQSTNPISNENPIETSNLELKFENRIGKRKKKKELNFSELKFEVEYLNLEEQLKEVELKKLKYKEFKFQCDQCGVGFITDDVFEEHKIRHQELSGPHKCTICHLYFKSHEVLSQHMLGHRRRFKCVLCASVFSRWSHCIAHRYKCGATVQPAACVQCAKIFNNEYSLKIHMKIHKTENKYNCEKCDRKFGSKQRLTVHMRSHTGIRPFSCTLCGRMFATRSNLRAHAAVHERAAHYCVECHTYYKTEKSLKRHYKESARHATEKSLIYACQECEKLFSTEKSLNSHINSRHSTGHRCTQCDKTFSNNSNLNKHMKCIHDAK